MGDLLDPDLLRAEPLEVDTQAAHLAAPGLASTYRRDRDEY